MSKIEELKLKERAFKAYLNYLHIAIKEGVKMIANMPIDYEVKFTADQILLAQSQQGRLLLSTKNF